MKLITLLFLLLLILPATANASGYETKGNSAYSTPNSLNYGSIPVVPQKADTSHYPGYSADQADQFLSQARQKKLRLNPTVPAPPPPPVYNNSPSSYQSTGSGRAPSGVY